MDTQNLVAGATDAHATMVRNHAGFYISRLVAYRVFEIADVSADMKTPALVTEATDDEDVTMVRTLQSSTSLE